MGCGRRRVSAVVSFCFSGVSDIEGRYSGRRADPWRCLGSLTMEKWRVPDLLSFALFRNLVLPIQLSFDHRFAGRLPGADQLSNRFLFSSALLENILWLDPVERFYRLWPENGTSD